MLLTFFAPGICFSQFWLLYQLSWKGHHSGVSRDVSKEKLTSFFNSQASFFTQLDLESDPKVLFSRAI